MKKMLLLFVTCVILLSISGCQTWTGGVASSSTPIEGREYTVLGPSSGTDNTWYILGVPISTSCSTKAALNTAVRKLDGDGMINVTADSKMYFYFVVLRNTLTVQGDVIKFTDTDHNH